jgi:hypothetical protein
MEARQPIDCSSSSARITTDAIRSAEGVFLVLARKGTRLYVIPSLRPCLSQAGTRYTNYSQGLLDRVSTLTSHLRREHNVCEGTLTSHLRREHNVCEDTPHERNAVAP